MQFGCLDVCDGGLYFGFLDLCHCDVHLQAMVEGLHTQPNTVSFTRARAHVHCSTHTHMNMATFSLILFTANTGQDFGRDYLGTIARAVHAVPGTSEVEVWASPYSIGNLTRHPTGYVSPVK